MPFGIDIKYEDDYCVGERKMNDKKPKKEVSQHKRKTDRRTRKITHKWTEVETSLFYRALQMYGSNLDLIHKKMGKGFSRDDITTKFRYESRTNSNLIAVAMNNRTNVQLNGVLSFSQNALAKGMDHKIEKSTTKDSDSDCVSSSFSGSE